MSVFFLQLIDSMKLAAEKMDRTQKLHVLQEAGVLKMTRSASTGGAPRSILAEHSVVGETGAHQHLARVRGVMARLKSGASDTICDTQETCVHV